MRSYKRHSSRRHGRKSHRRHKRGGASMANPSSYTSASSYGMAVNGPLDTQISNSLTSSGSNGQSQSTQSVGLQGQNIGIPSSQLFKMNGGKRGRSRRHKRGGIWGTIISQASAPLALLGLQQSYKKKH
jgi:hypothetical protein